MGSLMWPLKAAVGTPKANYFTVGTGKKDDYAVSIHITGASEISYRSHQPPTTGHSVLYVQASPMENIFKHLV